MDQETLRKVQMTQLEIAKEIKRVCEKFSIRYFLYRGTFLGAVRHQGFIPWDDDMDFAMLREDYERFCAIAPRELGDKYFLQTWHSDPNYAHPYGKVRKRGTVYVEAKSKRLEENGFYVDVYPLDYAPSDEKQRRKLAFHLLHLYRLKLMKSGYTPWKEESRIVWKKRIGYIPYQMVAALLSQQKLISLFEKRIRKVDKSDLLYEQSAMPVAYYFPTQWYADTSDYSFEDTVFPGNQDYDRVLSSLYGDYMTPLPEGKRENRHQIMELDFGEG